MKRIIFLILGLCIILPSEAQTPSRDKNNGAALSVRRERVTSSTRNKKDQEKEKDSKKETTAAKSAKAASTKKSPATTKSTATTNSTRATTAASRNTQANDTSNRPRFMPRRLTEQQTAKPEDDRAQLDFPVAADMPADVVWRRDIYRTLDLTKDANATLYYPLEQQGDQINLFTYLFIRRSMHRLRNAERKCENCGHPNATAP